jgi:hypothetical protein
MSLSRHIERLAAADRWAYAASQNSAAEPAAWAALALLAQGDVAAALRPAQWLARLQQADGAVGVSAAEAEPRWPTSLAMLTWCAWDRTAGATRFTEHIARAARWSLADRGETSPRSAMIGHNTTLTGWSWATNTHSWLEPTCFFVLALRAAGYGQHARTLEGAQLVLDRLLPAGGANYGNTIVLGQPLLPHVEPTGVAMWALAGEQPSDQRVEKSLDYLEREIGPALAPASLAFACLGLTAHGRRPSGAEAWCVQALEGVAVGAPLGVYEQSLLLLAGRADFDWLHSIQRAAVSRRPAPLDATFA